MVDKATDTYFLQGYPQGEMPIVEEFNNGGRSPTRPPSQAGRFSPVRPPSGRTKSSPTRSPRGKTTMSKVTNDPGRPPSAKGKMTQPSTSSKSKANGKLSPTRPSSPAKAGSRPTSPAKSAKPSSGRPGSGRKLPPLPENKTRPKSLLKLGHSSEQKEQIQAVEKKDPDHPKDTTEDGFRIRDLSNQGMTAIPTNILSKKDIGELNLSCNNLRGVPSEIKRLVNLTKLDLSKNGIRCTHQQDYGGLPQEMGELHNLRELLISECNLPFIPPAIWRIASLKVLDVSRNKISELLPDIGQLTSLRKLNLQQTSITTLPAEIAYCQDLEEILLYGNAMDSLPETLPDIPNLRVLAVNYRSFCSVVDSYMENLLRKGQIKSEHIPLVVFELSALENLDLESTKINNIPDMYTESLQEFSLCRNFLQEVPETIYRLADLQVLDMSQNIITVLPSDISHIQNLTVLKVNDNKLEKIPQSIGQLIHLEELEIGGNKIRNLPSEIGHLAKMRSLLVDRNNIHGLPEEICNLTQLETLDVTHNSVTKLPIQLYKLTKLKAAHGYKGLKKYGLWLYKNPLTQPPEEVWKTDNPQEIFDYLKKLQISRTKNLQRQKLLLIGDSQTGKTSLANALVLGRSELTNGAMDKTRVLSQLTWKTENQVEFVVCDIAGDEAYTMTCPLFLDDKALVLLVYDLSMYSSQQYHHSIGRWLNLLSEYSPGVVVKLVGTQCDLCSDQTETIKTDVWKWVKGQIEERHHKLMEEMDKLQREKREILAENDDPSQVNSHLHQIRVQEEQLERMLAKPLKISPDILTVTSSESRCGIRNLIQELEIMATDKTLFPHAQRYIPDQWNKLCVALKQQKSLYLLWENIEAVAVRFQVSGKGLEECVQYLHDIGEIFWFKQVTQLAKIVFHRPHAFVEVVSTLYRHDVQDFLCYSQSKVFSSRGGLSIEEFTQVKDNFKRYGQISRPLLQCFWFYLQIDNQTFAEFLELLPKLGLCYSIPEPTVPGGKNFHLPLLVLPWFNRDDSNKELQELWQNSPNGKTKQLCVDYYFPFRYSNGLFQRVACKVQDSLSERLDWEDAVFAVSDKTTLLMCRTLDTGASGGSHIELSVRSEELSDIHELLKDMMRLLESELCQSPGLYWTRTLSHENCRAASWSECFPTEIFS